LLEKYLNGQLDPALQDELEVHLLSCPQCLEHAETLKVIRASLANAPHTTTSAGSQFWRLGWVRIGAAAAVLIMGAILVIRLVQDARKPPQTANTPTAIPPAPTAVPSPRNDAGNTEHPDHPGQRAEKNSRPVKKPDLEKQEAQKPDTKTPETQVATEHEPSAPPKPGNGRKEPSPGMNDEDAVELYRLAAVQAPPYTFNQPGGSASPGTGQGTKSSSAFPSMTGPASAFFQQGMLAYVEGHYDDASRLLEKVVQSQPGAVPANFYLGVCRLLQGHPLESSAPLKAVLAAPASSFTQSAHFYLAKAYLQMAQLEDAEREMQAAAALSGSLTAEAQSLTARIHALREHASR
jgi:TolA-binding protein